MDKIADELVVAVDDHLLAIDLGVDRAVRRVGDGIGRRMGAEPGAEIVPAHLGRPGDADEREDRRRDVDEADRRGHVVRRQPGAVERDEDERDVHLLFVERRAVIAAAMLAELLAVIGGEDDERVRARLAQVVDEAPDLGVREVDLAVVQAHGVPRAVEVAGVALVGLVRLEVVRPDEHVRRVLLVEEADDLIGAAGGVEVLVLDVLEAVARLLHRAQAIAIDGEHRRGIERGRLVALALEHLGQRHVAGGVEAERGERVDELAGQERGDAE